MRACETFESGRGFTFPTYCKNGIRTYMARSIANFARTVRTPVHVHEARIQCNRAAVKFVAIKGRAASLDELARLTGLTPCVVARVFTQTQEVLSLDAPLSGEDEETVGDASPDDGPTPLDALIAKERIECARASLAALPERERFVVEQHTGDDEVALADIGSTLAAERTGRLGLSRERVRQIEQNALETLRRRTDKGLRLDS